MNENEEIKSRLPIEQVVGGYIPLKKAGRIYKALCPFHGEKTPSFSVNPERGIFKCFGCGEGGDIFDFVMKMEGLTFPEALRLLAEQAGVKIEERNFKDDKANSGISKQRLFSLNTYAAKLWHTILTQHPKAESARTYLKNRGVHDETIAMFQIGYAPLGSVTNQSLRKADFTSEEITQAGDPGKFQDRITFPIADITGRIVGFTGRLLETPEDPKDGRNRGPKYWNTPETPAFVKSRTLYALHLAKRAIQEEDTAILAEGQMDVVMLHQSGFTNSVASSGTALTVEQIALLGRFSSSISFAYDGDKAGIEATKRGIELVLQAELNPFVINSPAGKDPADILQKGREEWETAYTDRKPALEWLIDQSFKENPGNGPLEKKKIVQTLLPWLARVKNDVEREEWLRLLAARLQTDEQNVRTALSRLIKPTTTTTSASRPEREQGKKVNRAEVAAAILLAFPSIFPTVKDQIDSLLLGDTTPFISESVALLKKSPPDLKQFLKETLSDTERKSLSLEVEEILHPYAESGTDEVWALEEFMVLARHLRSEAKEESKTRLAAEIRQAQQSGDTARLQELFSRLKSLI